MWSEPTRALTRSLRAMWAVPGYLPMVRDDIECFSRRGAWWNAHRRTPRLEKKHLAKNCVSDRREEMTAALEILSPLMGAPRTIIVWILRS